jgi:hypothetical protein
VKKQTAIALIASVILGGTFVGAHMGKAQATQIEVDPRTQVEAHADWSLVMEVTVGDIGGNREQYVLDEGLTLGDCVKGVRAMGKPIFRKYETVNVVVSYACDRD